VSDTLPPEHDKTLTEVSSLQRTEIGEPLSEVLAQLTEGVALLTLSGAVVSWNPSAAHLTGYDLNEINDTGFWQLFEPPDTIVALVQQAQQGNPVDERLMLVRADGQRLPIGVRCFPLRHLDPMADRIVMVLRDLSEMEALHHQLLQSERLGMLGRLAGAVSHEIRNPLTAIFLQTDILEDELHASDGGNRNQILRSLYVIKEEVTRLHELVQQYLSLARLSNLQREPIDLSVYLLAFCEEIQGDLDVRGVALQRGSLDGLGHVALHPNSFRRVLINLFNNAVEAMPKGGTLTLAGYIELDAVRLELTDTGCGVPPEQMTLLFSPLHTTKPEGTGLGLYLVQEIVSAHDGQIAAMSEPGVGTTFTITLPRLAADVTLPIATEGNRSDGCNLGGG
jgi:two-component system sensor histidine kinase HydH